MLFWVNLDVFPTATFPPARDEVHLGLFFRIKIVIISHKLALWFFGTYLLHFIRPRLDVFNVSLLLFGKDCSFFVLLSSLLTTRLIWLVVTVLIENILTGIPHVV